MYLIAFEEAVRGVLDADRILGSLKLSQNTMPDTAEHERQRIISRSHPATGRLWHCKQVVLMYGKNPIQI